MVVAYDSDAILPSIKKINDAGIKAIAYDVQFEDPNALYITFDNIGVGRLMAQGDLRRPSPPATTPSSRATRAIRTRPSCSPASPEVLKPAMDSGKIKNVCETFTDGWKPDNAQKEMEQCLTKQNNKVDAVVAENDGMASGVVAALKAQGMAGYGAGLRPGRRSRGDQPRRARHADRVDLEGLAACSARRRRKRRSRWPTARRDRDLPGVVKFNKGKKGVEMNTILLRADADHQGHAEPRHRRRLDHQGQGLRRREEGRGQGLRLIRFDTGAGR